MPEQLRLLQDLSLHPSEAQDAVVIRESRRARRLILQVVPPYRLELVVPRGTRPREVEAFVARHEAWIERARDELRHRYPPERHALPGRIELRAIDEIWSVQYRNQPDVKPSAKMSARRLEIAMPGQEEGMARRVLRNWLLGRARVHLKPWLGREAAVLGDAPRNVQVRLQRTRWGSCSGQRNISLNANLLFLDRAVVRYLMVHELCHLRVLNHSRRFWRLVERYEPDYRTLDRRLSDAWTDVPAWALAV